MAIIFRWDYKKAIQLREGQLNGSDRWVDLRAATALVIDVNA